MEKIRLPSSSTQPLIVSDRCPLRLAAVRRTARGRPRSRKRAAPTRFSEPRLNEFAHWTRGSEAKQRRPAIFRLAHETQGGQDGGQPSQERTLRIPFLRSGHEPGAEQRVKGFLRRQRPGRPSPKASARTPPAARTIRPLPRSPGRASPERRPRPPEPAKRRRADRLVAAPVPSGFATRRESGRERPGSRRSGLARRMPATARRRCPRLGPPWSVAVLTDRVSLLAADRGHEFHIQRQTGAAHPAAPAEEGEPVWTVGINSTVSPASGASANPWARWAPLSGVVRVGEPAGLAWSTI